jgi:hypothetical protein
MFSPSDVKPSSVTVVKEGKGTYAFDDAYLGVYEFFENRPISRPTEAKRTPEKKSSR